jgi:simple sugar transport system ATP-binding protein
VEILKALQRDCRILVLDEPTAVLAPQEVAGLLAVIRRLTREGLAVLFVSHKLVEVLELSDRVTVLRHGRVEGTMARQDADANALAALMVGRPMMAVDTSQKTDVGAPVLSVRGLSSPVLRDVSFDVRAGEILGVAGVSGNGQTELAALLSGISRLSAGTVTVDGRSIAGVGPAKTMAAGVGRIPEDRHGAVVADLDVATNLALEHLDEFRSGASLDRNRLTAHARDLIERYAIKARPIDLVRTLSGGNVQKVLLARVLDRRPKVLIVSQPTRGLDVGATEYVRGRLLEERARGAAILLFSEDLEEVLALSDRVMVMYGGAIAGEFDRATADLDRLGLLMVGAA